MFDNVKDWLSGKKAYIVAGIGAIVWLLARVGVIDPEAEGNIYKVLFPAGLAALRAGVKKSE